MATSSQDDGLTELFVSFGDLYQNVMTRHAIPRASPNQNGRISAAAVRFSIANNDAKNGWLEHAKSGTAINPAAKRSILDYRSRI
jgi:pyruvoyl-dependent arginine decarboxylase (PvlArgDC)